MSTVKTKITEEKVLEFLINKFVEISNLKFIKGGELSQAFSFKHLDEELVVRFGNNTRGYEKDKYAHDNFSQFGIPIPEVLDIGQSQDYIYVISKKSPGVMLIDVSYDEHDNVFEELITILDKIHDADISGTNGFGTWQADGSYEFESWKEYILGVNQYVLAKENSPSLFETSFLEKEVWDFYYGKMESLLQYCNEERYLVHGDYGSDNVITSEGKITGVIDWAGSKYGDFLYDIAWLNFWHPDRNPLELFVDFYQNKNREVPYFFKRVLCYQIRIALSSLSFYAYSNQKDKYEFAKERINKILDSK